MPKGRNFPKGTHVPLTLKEFENENFKEEIVMKKRGRPPGTKMGPMRSEEDPRTPFEALRYLLKLSRSDWAKILNCSVNVLYQIETANPRTGIIANVSLAKRMQEEARQRGVAITLDELYQHVALWE